MKKIIAMLLILSSVHADRVKDYIDHIYRNTLFKPLAAKQEPLDNNLTKVDIILTYRDIDKTILFYQRVIVKFTRTTTIEISKKILGTKTVFDYEMNDENDNN